MTPWTMNTIFTIERHSMTSAKEENSKIDSCTNIFGIMNSKN
jgi:hypothetical protein